jgi:lysophospholipid acyltransferase (LPLAT)-like uncharacterized protein
MSAVSSEPQPRATSLKKRRSGIVVPHKPVWYQRLAAWLVFVIARIVALTLRTKWVDPHNFRDGQAEQPVIIAIWHNRLALCMEGYRLARRRTKGMAALVSASKDGGLLAAILERFGVQPVRGSSSRRGPQALLELTTWAERGYDLAITPDGPRGPCYVVQDGVMGLAQVTGLTIVPAAVNVRWKITVKSWDRFQIPLPFSRCEVVMGKSLSVPREVTDEERALLKAALEKELKSISRD